MASNRNIEACTFLSKATMGVKETCYQVSTSCFASQTKVPPETTTRNILNGHLICQVFSRLCRLYSLQFVSSVCLSSLNLSFSTKKENVDIYIYIYFSCGYSLTFQVVKMVIVYAPEPEHRKKILCCAKRSGFRVSVAPLL